MTETGTDGLRVLMTADTVGGVWTYALELARALAPHGVSFDLATMGAPLRPDQWAEAAALPGVRVHESRWKLEWMPDPWADVEAAAHWLRDLEAEVRPDLVHLNGYAHGAVPFRAPKLVVGHSCVLSWWEAVHGRPAPMPEWAAYRDAVRAGLRAADAVAAPTGAMLSSLRRHYGPFGAAAHVLPNARSAALFRPEPSREPFVLAAGRLWDAAKNVAALDAVAPCLPWPVLIAGDDREPGRDGEPAPDVPGGARRLGRLAPPELAGYLARAAVYALPARYEPFGLSALEAALSGCALVLGDIPSLREVWGDAARFVPPDDAGALRDALCSLISDDTERSRLAASARERAARLYTPERAAAAYLRAYRGMLS